MSSLRFSFVLIILLAFASQIFGFEAVVLTQEGYAGSSPTEAEKSIASAYEAILEAEKAGANVSTLLPHLNEAGGLLAKGQMTNSTEDLDEAIRLAEEVENAAVKLKDAALTERLQSKVFAMIASVVGVALTAFGSLWVWHLMKNRHGGTAFS